MEYDNHMSQKHFGPQIFRHHFQMPIDLSNNFVEVIWIDISPSQTLLDVNPWPGNLKISPSWEFLTILEVRLLISYRHPQMGTVCYSKNSNRPTFPLVFSVRKCPICSSPERTQRTHPNEKTCCISTINSTI